MSRAIGTHRPAGPLTRIMTGPVDRIRLACTTPLPARATYALVLLLLMPASHAAIGKVKTIKLATGEIVAFVFTNDAPAAAETSFAAVRRAGTEIEKEPEGTYRFNWAFDLGPRGGADLRTISHVTVDEVSGKSIVPVFSGKPTLEEGELVIWVPGELVSKATYPWLYLPEPTMVIFRIQLEQPGQKPQILLQPLVVKAITKQKLKAFGYLP